MFRAKEETVCHAFLTDKISEGHTTGNRGQTGKLKKQIGGIKTSKGKYRAWMTNKLDSINKELKALVTMYK